MKLYFDGSFDDSLDKFLEALASRRPDLDVFELLGVVNDCSLEEYRQAWKQWMKKNHQDRGGNLKANQLLNGSITYFGENEQPFDDYKLKRQETFQELERQEAEEAEASFSFSKGGRVTLQRLKKSEFNGLKGIVISDFSEGRYNVKIEGGGVFALKRLNLRSEVSVDSLPTKDLKTILAYKNEQEFIASAMEKSELQAKVLKVCSVFGRAL